MSRYIPPMKVQKEQIAQAIRRSVGLKSGAYVRVKVGPKVGTVLRTTAEREGLQILSETEFQAILSPQKPAQTEAMAQIMAEQAQKEEPTSEPA
jgi:hypothetical protein